MSDAGAMRVMVAMSGGVDSSVAAALVRDAGHDVTGVTLKLWGGDSDSGCCSVSDVDDARRVAQQLDIEHLVFNFGDDFDRHVVAPYVEAHRRGETPNPCIECNRHLKFDRLVARALALGFDAVATGHHARRLTDVDGTFRVGRGADDRKDQSYVLYTLTQAQLQYVRFPVGDLTKTEVRAQAARLGLRTADKAESQDVCFITATGGREAFLGPRIGLRPGRVIDRAGAEVGEVAHVELVTIGQRKGLGVAGSAEPRYAVEVDVASATVTVGDRADLLEPEVRLTSVQWSGAPVTDVALLAQCSAHGTPQPAVLRPDLDQPDAAVLRWTEPQRRVARGQSVVLYAGDRVVGGGICR